jgi:hypothetical protein
MSSDVWLPSPDPDPNLAPNLRLQVRETRPGRWMWELIDAQGGTSFEKELEFDFPADARRAGLARLAQLTPSLGGAKMVAKAADPSARRRLIVVSRGHDALYEQLVSLSAETRTLDVMLDRRRGERRGFDRRRSHSAPSSVRWLERRRHDRRTGGERRSRQAAVSLQTRGFWLVPRSDDPTAMRRASAHR